MEPMVQRQVGISRGLTWRTLIPCYKSKDEDVLV